ncbi:hypothetical protein [Alishewanella longhuensis]
MAYRSKQLIEAELEQDRILASSGILLSRGILTPAALASSVQQLAAQIARVAAVATGRPKLTSAKAVIWGIDSAGLS